MTESRRRQVIADMATDPALAERVRNDPDAVAREYGLNVDDMAVLRALRTDAGGAGPDVLDERLSKSGLFFGGALHGSDASLQCNQTPDAYDGQVGGANSPVEVLCNGIQPAGFVCDGQPAELQCNGVQPAGFVCNGQPAELQCNGAQPVGLQCNGLESVEVLCNGAQPAEVQCNGQPVFGEFAGESPEEEKDKP
jgi:hypothetical protein